MYPFSEPVRQALFYVLPAAAIGLALAVPWVERRGTRARRAHLGLLALTALLGFLLWSNQNWERRRYFNPYEFFHYYVGAKYAPELGYRRLYDAAVLVDRETGFVSRSKDLANLSAHLGGPEFKRRGAVHAEAEAIRAPFTPARWEEFRRDVVFFREALTPGMWEQLLHDKGYNATPAWTLVGGFLARRAPLGSPAFGLLVLLDPLLMASGFALIAWAFGLRAMLFAVTLVFTHYATSHAHFRAAFLRTDWLVALVASACCLAKGRPLLGGAALAWATLSRVFPVLFALGPLGVLIAHLRGPPEARRAAQRFVLGGVLLGGTVLALTLAQGGLEPWREFQAKIVEHDQRPASDTIGFKKLFLWTIDFAQGEAAAIRARFEERRALWWSLQAAGAVALALFLRRRPLDEALCLSYPFVWLAASPAYYYYALLLVPALWGAARLARPARAVALALVFATSLCARAFHGGPTFQGHFAFKLSLVMGLLALGLLVCARLERTDDDAGQG